MGYIFDSVNQTHNFEKETLTNTIDANEKSEKAFRGKDESERKTFLNRNNLKMDVLGKKTMQRTILIGNNLETDSFGETNLKNYNYEQENSEKGNFEKGKSGKEQI